MDDRKPTEKFHCAAERVAWEIMSTNVRLVELRDFWAKQIGVTGPQWMILAVLANADRHVGLSVGALSKTLRVAQSFVTAQTNLLEQKSLLRRKNSTEDARVVNLFLTERAYKQLASVGSKKEDLNEFIYSGLDLKELVELAEKISTIKQRVEKALLRASSNQ